MVSYNFLCYRDIDEALRMGENLNNITVNSKSEDLEPETRIVITTICDIKIYKEDIDTIDNKLNDTILISFVKKLLLRSFCVLKNTILRIRLVFKLTIKRLVYVRVIK